tara:strand:- start:28990 stop:29991 length:1002 start_codon:yes stop_codon:yes gene_type:complete
MVKKYDYLIIGQGVAGSAMAWKLYFKKKSFIILDSEIKNSASNAALGIYNPITGRRKALTWNVVKLFKNLEDFYKRIEDYIGTKILFKKKIYRLLKDHGDFNDWSVRLSNKKFHSFIKELSNDMVITDKSGYVDVRKYINETRKYFKTRDRYRKYKLNNKDISIVKNKIKLKEFDSKNVIMCLGINQKKIKCFDDLEIKEVSGSSILTESNISMNHILNKKISIINSSKNTFHIGSTYHNGSENTGYNKILDQAENILNKKLKLKEVLFGIRSASKDRRPIVGRHHNISNLFLINGLGSKGVSQSPYSANQLFDYIENNKELDKEINLKRFKT